MPRTNDIKRPEYTAALRIAPRGMLDEPKDPVRGVSSALKRVLETAQPRYAASARPLNIPAALPPLPRSSRRSASSVHARASASTEEEYSECSGVTSGIPCARKAGVNRLNSGRGRDDERSPPSAGEKGRRCNGGGDQSVNLSGNLWRVRASPARGDLSRGGGEITFGDRSARVASPRRSSRPARVIVILFIIPRAIAAIPRVSLVSRARGCVQITEAHSRKLARCRDSAFQ